MTTSPVVRDAKFYLADGDLAICSALSLGDSVTVFRVHKVVMAYHSPVFRSMLGLPPVPGTQEMYDDAPVVRVTDSAEELRALLDALYDPGALHVARWDPDAPLTLTPAMRLARKYDIDAVCKRIVDTLKESWPRSYEEWLCFRAEYAVRSTMCNPLNKEFPDSMPLWAQVPEPGAAVRFAREFDVPDLLPFAYYTLAGIGADDEWERYTRDWSMPMSRPARWGLLGREDLVHVLQGREQLGRSVEMLEHEWLSPARLKDTLEQARSGFREPCDYPEDDSQLVTMLKAVVHRPFPQCPDPLDVLESMYNISKQWPLCSGCTHALKRRIRDQQRKIWDNLHFDFRLYAQ
ncbi:hypothetical protein PsYK624_114730 [Phanerochaete sordida]|uniref:BTB domain-containing protein n=1 Tax=Phanerochaete sordida TaxID=48140 RepID=A0A9P3LHG1_9APHY|nr:hypothetical protein PsYK624_114730 [Phanerochaete sordida]